VIAELVIAALLVAAPTHPAHRPAATVQLDGVDVHLRPGTTQVVTVNHSHGYSARVTFWRRTSQGWVGRFTTDDGRIGYGGLVRGSRRHQGSGTTPLGTYLLPWAFGSERPHTSWALRYRSIRRGDFWVQDNASRFYNRYRNERRGGFRWWLPSSDPNSSERLTDFRRQYRLAIVIDFNHRQVRHRGSGIFLHVNGRGATAGCVSAPLGFVQKTLAALDPADVPVIAVGQ
jgi:L,D-peptidoglycan transpeptidase YkuD (ErfK/YbiS/YcfS/YnhG family)